MKRRGGGGGWFVLYIMVMYSLDGRQGQLLSAMGVEFNTRQKEGKKSMICVFFWNFLMVWRHVMVSIRK